MESICPPTNRARTRWFLATWKKAQAKVIHLMLNYLTPHAKWHIHSNYYDNDRMLTLSRGIEPLWLSEQDAEKLERDKTMIGSKPTTITASP